MDIAINNKSLLVHALWVLPALGGIFSPVDKVSHSGLGTFIYALFISDTMTSLWSLGCLILALCISPILTSRGDTSYKYHTCVLRCTQNKCGNVTGY